MKKTSHRVLLLLLLGLLGMGYGSALDAQLRSQLPGGWLITGWESPSGETVSGDQRGLFVFTETGQYSMMFVIGDDREPLGDNPSDTEVAAAYRPLIANSGRYSVSGDTITYESFISKDPAHMSRFSGTGGEGNALTLTYSIDNGVLTLLFGEGGPMEGSTATLRRPGS